VITRSWAESDHASPRVPFSRRAVVIPPHPFRFDFALVELECLLQTPLHGVLKCCFNLGISPQIRLAKPDEQHILARLPRVSPLYLAKVIGNGFPVRRSYFSFKLFRA